MSKTKFIIWQVITFFIMIFAIAIFFGLTEHDNHRRITTADIFKSGGVFSYLITFLGFNAIVFGIRDFFKFRSRDMSSPQTVSKLDELLLSNDHNGALALCRATDVNLAEIAEAGLNIDTKDKNAIANAMEETLQRHTLKIAGAPNKYFLIALFTAIVALLATSPRLLEVTTLWWCCSTPSDFMSIVRESLLFISIGSIVLLLSVFFYFLNKTKVNHYILELGIVAERIISRIKK